jgi:hypothetical protein
VRLRSTAALLGLAFALVGRAEDETLDRLSEMLTFSNANGEVRARLSGTLELEGYVFPQPAPAYIASRSDALFNPRFISFLDVQWGTNIYAFVQYRADRGFDPGVRHMRGRLDEYAMRWRPFEKEGFNIQVGKFATVVGNWVTRHAAWDNAFVTAPLVYEHLTGVWDDSVARTAEALLGWSRVRPRAPRGVPATDKGQRLPVIWGPSYTTGVAVSGEVGRFLYAAEMKHASIASRPRIWEAEDLHFRHPTWSGRVGYRPNHMWNIGLSGSTGTYLRPSAVPTLPPGRGMGDYRQIVLAQDIGFAWHHLQIWAELFETRFEMPGVGNADLVAYYVEAKYKFTPQLFGAVRWNEQLFGRIADPAMGGETRWGLNVRRLDLAAGFRFTPHTQLKIQYSAQHEENGPREVAHLLSAQLMLRF